ncbi:hypothetical protein SAMN05421753_1149 [Planctomicrobium piriforme]|uniref:Uncharacterized protein n=1 Tax=Planctomicrobium piriforme TaxID=1576369 RepID=A0A1I3MHS8_9PLAN|nr:hypothetical protein SAMN05421753_1149 [Planctomicrobium piriforme]
MGGPQEPPIFCPQRHVDGIDMFSERVEKIPFCRHVVFVSSCHSHAVFGVNFSETELMQYRCPVGV